MIPFGFRGFRIPPTSLYLNGPFLSFTGHPEDAIVNVGGISTFTGYSVASHNEIGDGNVDGIIEYRWYDQNGPLTNGPNIVGAGSTILTISNISASQDRNLYLRSTYIPGSYASQRTFSSYKTTGKAVNSPLDSNVATLKVRPNITITLDPTTKSSPPGETATFSADASIDNTSYPLQYYWTLNGSVIPNSNSKSIEIEKVGTENDKVRFYAFTNFEGETITSSSAEADFIYTAPRSLIIFEAFSSSNSSLYSTQETNLDDGSFTLTDATFANSNYNIITFYPKEKNITLKMDISAARGSDNGANNGGEGGTSTVEIALTEDSEYTILGISNNSSVFVYEGSELLVAVGQGGNAGTSGNGGAGGGVDLAGANGSGTDAGAGGSRIAPGNLSLTGIHGSVLAGSGITLYPGDSIATSPAGGRAISCSRGTYWINQGISACSDNSGSPIKFRINDGTEISSSDAIIRGFKPGYTVTTTAGDGLTNGGDGGNGATGGEGGTAGAGGGGGSGYTNGVATIISSNLGGNVSATSSITFRL